MKNVFLETVCKFKKKQTFHRKHGLSVKNPVQDFLTMKMKVCLFYRTSTVFVDNFASIYLQFLQMTKVFMGPKPYFIRMWMLAKIQMMTLKKFRQNGDKFGWMTIFQTLPLPFLRPVPK